MKVIIDISRLHPLALKRGVGTYSLNLFQALQKLSGKNKYILKKDTFDQGEADLIHYPYFDPFFLTLPWQTLPFVVTIHDFIPLKFPQYYPAGLRGQLKWQVQKKLVKRAAAIITDSQSSKKDIKKILNYPNGKIIPIYLAAGQEFRKIKSTIILDSIRVKYNLPKNFLLYVGDVNWNKNLQGLIRALKIPLHKHNLKLVLIGEALKEIKFCLEQRIIKLGFVPDKDLAAIYNLATLYIQPSFYEGFGLPILEAMSCGCPVLTSNQGSLPEVAGQAVEYFNPYKKNGLNNKIKFLLKNKKRLNQLSNLGLKQAKKFSWQKTALAIQEVYEKVLATN